MFANVLSFRTILFNSEGTTKQLIESDNVSEQNLPSVLIFQWRSMMNYCMSGI